MLVLCRVVCVTVVGLIWFIIDVRTFLCKIMTYFTTWEDFAKAAEMLYVNDPMKVS